MQDAPPVPGPVQLSRSNSQHRPSGSDSSTASSVNSAANSNSSSQSPIGSAASSVETFSALIHEPERYDEDRGMRVAGLNIKSQQKPGLRAEQPKERSRSRSPQQNFTRSSPPREIALPIGSPAVPQSLNWPLESPMDPAMHNGKLEGDVGQSAPSSPVLPDPLPRALAPAVNLAPNHPSGEDYDPYRPNSPQPGSQLQPRQPLRSKTDDILENKTFRPNMPSRSQTTQVTKGSSLAQEGPRPQARSPLMQPPPIPQNAPRPGLARRQTTGTKAICRGCNKQIEGKSVKAADGRLTGRWHKACFCMQDVRATIHHCRFLRHQQPPLLRAALPREEWVRVQWLSPRYRGPVFGNQQRWAGWQGGEEIPLAMLHLRQLPRGVVRGLLRNRRSRVL